MIDKAKRKKRVLFYFDKKNIYTYTNFCNKNETVDGWRRINYQTSTNSMEDKNPDIVGRFVLYSAFQFPIKKKRITCTCKKKY